MAMNKTSLLEKCLVKATIEYFIAVLNKVISDPSAGVPTDITWLSSFVTDRSDGSNGDFMNLTRTLLVAVLTLTAAVWAEQIGSHRVGAGYTGKVDLDAAYSTRQFKATAFLKTFRTSIRTTTLDTLLIAYTATLSASQLQWTASNRVVFNTFVLEPVVLHCIYVAHCVLLNIPATFDDILNARSDEELLNRFETWKTSRATDIVVLNAMLKAYFIAGYCVNRRLATVCESKRSYKLCVDVHKVSLMSFQFPLQLNCLSFFIFYVQ